MTKLINRPTVTGMRCSECGGACYHEHNGQVLHVRSNRECPWINIPQGHYQSAPMPGITRL